MPSKPKSFVRDLAEHVELHRDPKNGIAWVKDGRTGMGHSAHPNIDSTGSVKGMISRGFWRPDAVIVRSHGYIFNTSVVSATDEYDRVAAQNCQCRKCLLRRVSHEFNNISHALAV